ncbi:MAG: type II toxin-antitoxin system RelE/ParE family toxin [Clostridiales bacterium]|nr:type II toxin-antitoxin system RelE/ParE family toxin [Clostridiales bacterium]
MENKSYHLRYLPLFEQDLINTANYIANVLKNEDAALRLIDDVEAAILERLDHPVSFEPYHSVKKRDYPYYRIYVRNYVVYYVVIDDVMEVRRLMYGARDTDNHL